MLLLLYLVKLNLTTVLSSEIEIAGYNLVLPDQSQRGGSVACFLKNYFI